MSHHNLLLMYNLKNRIHYTFGKNIIYAQMCGSNFTLYFSNSYGDFIPVVVLTRSFITYHLPPMIL